MARNFRDWVAAMAEATPGNYVPTLFRKWSALPIVGAALRKQAWYEHGAYKVTPNLYVILVGPPATGKGIALTAPVSLVLNGLCTPLTDIKKDKEEAENVWRRYLPDKWDEPLHVMRGHITYPQLCRNLTTTGRRLMGLRTAKGEGVEPFEEHAMAIATAEFGVFMTKHDFPLQTLMTEGWDSSSPHEYHTKHQGVDLIEGPTLTWLAAATPDEFIANMPANAAKQGLLSRIIPVYKEQGDSVMEIRSNPFDMDYIEELRKDLGHISKIKGEFTWSREAENDLVVPWLDPGRGAQGPKPDDPIMRDYCNRRYAHLIKMCMCLSAARRDTRVMEAEDWVDAAAMLFEAEAMMPKLLRRFSMSDAGKMADELIDMVRNAGGRMSAQMLMRLAMRKIHSIAEVEKTIDVIVNTRALNRDGDLITIGEGL